MQTSFAVLSQRRPLRTVHRGRPVEPMGDNKQPAPTSTPWPPAASEPEALYTSRLTTGSRFAWAIRLTGLLLIGGFLAASVASSDQAIDFLAVLGSAIAGFLIGSHWRRRNVELERAYSSHLEAMSQRLRTMAYQDSLTGLFNHRYFREQLQNEVDRAQRYGGAFSILMLDVNHFKDVNDTYGHLMGDTLLSYVAQLIAESVRSSDVAARYGGDEFAIILPETDRKAAMAAAGKLTNIISAARHWQGALLESLGVGVSVGVAAYPEDGRTADELLMAADAALYRSKAAARRRRPSRTRRRGSAKAVAVM